MSETQTGTAKTRRIHHAEMTLDINGLIYLAKTVPDTELEVIPAREHGEHGANDRSARMPTAGTEDHHWTQ